MLVYSHNLYGVHIYKLNQLDLFKGASSATVTVTVNALPTLVVTNPSAVCSPATVDLTASSVTTGSDTGLTLTYWTDASATTALTTPSAIGTSGTYYIKAVNTSGCATIQPVVVTINSASTNVTDIVSCNSYTWSVNGTTLHVFRYIYECCWFVIRKC